MPVLDLEPTVYPEELFREPFVPANAESQWWVLHMRPRMEKALARRCCSMQISFYLPLQERRTRFANRIQTSYLPLFPGYFFFRGNSEARLKTLETKMVAQCLPVHDQSRMQSDLSQVFRLISGNVPISLEDQLRPGTAIEITEGIFAGMTGKLLRRGTRYCFIVEVEILRQGVSIEVERSMFRVL